MYKKALQNPLVSKPFSKYTLKWLTENYFAWVDNDSDVDY